MSSRAEKKRRRRAGRVWIVVDDVAPFGPPTEDEWKRFFDVLSRESRLISECCTVVDSSEDLHQ